jgi:hypothetical protein
MTLQESYLTCGENDPNSMKIMLSFVDVMLVIVPTGVIGVGEVNPAVIIIQKVTRQSKPVIKMPAFKANLKIPPRRMDMILRAG